MAFPLSRPLPRLPPTRSNDPHLLLGMVLAGLLLVGSGCASPSRIERVEAKLASLEQRLDTMADRKDVAPPAREPSPRTASTDEELARLRADINDIRLLLLDLQMKAGR